MALPGMMMMMNCGLSTSSPLYVSKLQTSKADPKRNVISSCATRSGRRSRSRGFGGVGNSQNSAWGLGQGGILRRRVVVQCQADADGGVNKGFENVGGSGNSAAIEVEDRIADGAPISGKILCIIF